jgi:hypothetical protein
VQRYGEPDPVRAADQVPAVDLRDLLDHAAIARNAQVDRLARLLAELGQRRLGDADQVCLGPAPPGI